MQLDGRRCLEGTTIETDVCIIGAGVAGLVLARELAESGRDLVVLESGADASDEAAQALNDGPVFGDPYAGLRETRHRQLGGTACLWNTEVEGSVAAKYVPLDELDLIERPPRKGTGWPLRFEELRGCYERAHQLCGLGPYIYDASAWTRPGRALLECGEGLVSRVYQVGRRDALVATAVHAARDATNVRLYTRSTAARLETNGTGRVVLGAAVVSGSVRWTVRAKWVVLAAGAVENARILLTSGRGAEGLGNASGWVGRGFMEHPRDATIRVVPDLRSREVYAAAAFYDLHVASDATPIIGRLALADDAARAHALLNASASLLPRPRESVRRARRVLGRVGRMQSVASLLPGGGYGWSAHHAPERVYDGFTVLLNLEQAAHPENRVCLGQRRDALGVPLPELYWRWRPEEQALLERLRGVVANALEPAGLGRVSIALDSRPDPNAHHHAGTTRMHADSREGVVDADCRVHSLDNLFVTGASVFPTAGFANPALTIVALAVRLGDRMKGVR